MHEAEWKTHLDSSQTFKAALICHYKFQQQEPGILLSVNLYLKAIINIRVLSCTGSNSSFFFNLYKIGMCSSIMLNMLRFDTDSTQT